jgi:ADP-heptose:LPS heptosyltransferase
LTKLLAINFGGIGDEFLFLPTLKTVRECHPDWHITLLLEPRSRSVIQVTDLVDAVLTFDIKQKPLYISHLLDLLGLMREGGFDVVVSSGGSTLVSVLLFTAGIPVRVGYDSGGIARKLLTSAVPLTRHQYAAGMYHDLTAGLGLNRSQELPQAQVPAEATARMQAFLNSAGLSAGQESQTVLIHPGTSQLAMQKGIIKTWSAENWSRLVDSLSQVPNLKIILAGGPDDEQAVCEILAECKPGQVVNAFGQTKSLADLAALIQLADLLVCVDSAPMHLGVALHKPLVALFGPTDEKKLLPEDPRFRALRGQGTEADENVFRSPSGCRRRLPPAPDSGVRLQAEIVFQAVKDQLYAASGRGSFQECGR